MIDLGPHASFIVAAYSITLLALGALAWTTFADDRYQRRLLAELERQGIRRRSAAKLAKPKLTSAAKTRTAASRARKSSS